jgi:hypothetical protein
VSVTYLPPHKLTIGADDVRKMVQESRAHSTEEYMASTRCVSVSKCEGGVHSHWAFRLSQ